VIRSFRDSEAEKIFNRLRSRKYAGLEDAILRKLLAIHAARLLIDLTIPPGNRLEALRGDRKGQHSIRVNKQFRICFRWEEAHAYELEIVDYH
jgi:proteic killer suppression protein